MKFEVVKLSQAKDLEYLSFSKCHVVINLFFQGLNTFSLQNKFSWRKYCCQHDKNENSTFNVILSHNRSKLFWNHSEIFKPVWFRYIIFLKDRLQKTPFKLELSCISNMFCPISYLNPKGDDSTCKIDGSMAT